MKCPDVNPGEGTVSRTSTSLLVRAQADDADAWSQLVNTYSRRVYRWCRHAGLQPADAGNVVQEVFRAVARKLPEFRRSQSGDTFRGWLRRITQNKLRDHFRNLMRFPDQAVGGTDAHQRLMRLKARSNELSGGPDRRKSDPQQGDTPQQTQAARITASPSSIDELESSSGATSIRAADEDKRHAASQQQPSDELSFSESLLSEWGQDLVRGIRAQCSARDWKFFWRVVVDGQSAVEVGNEYGVSANAVRLVKMRVLRKLRESLGGSDRPADSA